MATTIEKTKEVMFLNIANFLPRIADSAGSCIKPTVTHETKNAVTAINPIP